MKKGLLIFLFSTSILFSQNYVQYVNPFIGTGGHGHTYPGATLPFGMMQLSPDTRIDGSWDGCSGYHYSDSIFYGFSHTHLSGTGISDYGDIMLMPVTKKDRAFTPNEYSSSFNHSSEKAEAGFYTVKLEEPNVTVNLTSTLRTGFHQYIFHDNEKAMIVLDLTHRDQLIDGEIYITDRHSASGYRHSKAWAQNQKIFYYIEFSKDFEDFKAEENAINIINDFDVLLKDDKAKVNFLFNVERNETLMVKVGISSVSVEGAKLNLETENPDWDFNYIRNEAMEAWEKELGKIEVTCDKKSDYEIFYTSLYHTMVVPNIWNDVDGKYRGMDDQIHKVNEGKEYTVFSLWDTFRAAHPLYTLIDQERSGDYVLTFINDFQQTGRLPVWELSGNETDCMIGVHSISVIADAVSKGLVDDKYKSILSDAMISTWKMGDYKGIAYMNSQNHLTIENESESVSKTLEYCYQYACMAEICKWAGEPDWANTFYWISLGYKNLFNTDAGFFEPRINGGWLPNFDPTQVSNNYTEANGWQYTFFVPHDITGMIELYGGKQKFHVKLDSLFGTNSKMTGREQPDITGLIGQYAHGNEPSHHIAYLYNYVGDFKSTSKIVSKICNEFYTNQPDGLSGNEDCGQMSAWYVLSAIGLYQVNPGSPYYTLTVPQVLSAKIHLENGNTISIKRDAGEINRIRWNGLTLDRLYLSYNEIMKGGELSFENSGTNEIKEGNILSTSNIFGSSNYPSTPVIYTENPIFKKETMVSITASDPSLTIYYVIRKNGNTDPTLDKEAIYTKPFKIKKNCKVVAFAYNSTTKFSSSSATCSLHKYPNGYSIEIKSTANPQYFANGPMGLLDGVNGDIDWRKGNWHGYQGQDFEAVIDTKKKKKHKKIIVTFLADNRSWIYYPIQLELFGSNDNQNYELIKTLDKSTLGLDAPTLDLQGITEMVLNIEDKPAYCYYKIKAINYGPLPKGHPGVENPSFIFIDEIEFK